MAFEKINILRSEVIATPVENIDTDQIIPARFLKATKREGFGEAMFRDWRYTENNELIADSVFALGNREAKILVAGKNFGCGSSREHAAWAIADYGFRVVVSSFFADIFKNNALNNGLLPVQVSEPFLAAIFDEHKRNNKVELEINLPQKSIEIVGAGIQESFPIGEYKRHCLENGLEDIDYLLTTRDLIEAYEKNMKKKIAVLPGDGIGPEIIAQAKRVLETIAEKYGHTFLFEEGLVGACAIDACGEPYPQATHELCCSSDAVLFGAIGDPKYDNDPNARVRPEQGLLKMRKSLGLFANLRPIAPFDALVDNSPLKSERIKGADLLIVRELTGGLYFGEPRGRSENGSVAFDTCVYSKEEIIRVAEKAFELARARKGAVTLVDKANVLATSRLWRETVKELHAAKYSDIALDFMFVDNAAMQLVTAPGKFDVLLTENLFGDILSDEASVITGSIGLLPSASVGKNVSLYEPIHGSYPQAKGKNIANPIATILSAAMMLEYSFGMKDEALDIRNGCKKAIENGVVTEDLGGSYGTTEVGAFICEMILRN